LAFLPVAVVREPRLRALPVQIIANPFDQAQVRVARYGLEGDETLDHGTRDGAGAAAGQFGARQFGVSSAFKTVSRDSNLGLNEWVRD